MNSSQQPMYAARLREALNDTRPSVRLQAAMAAGTRPDPADLDVLVEQCAVEPEFFVRDMLTWLLTRLPASLTVPRLLTEAGSTAAQARSQALHTLSKIGDPRGWAAITPARLRDSDDDVARSAWRAAAILVPPGNEPALADELVAQLGRGDRDVQLSLTRALVALADAAAPALREATAHPDPRVRTHALATERFREDPDAGFDLAVAEALRLDALASVASES
ncbi:HEAT repeat domain-containing protein [Phytoactinopolyspora mesophila]|uniref:HEAT repeat domain-containing protein n=1 Tax=Phytoactinopolyspora mesophila TaxID=2650750 RepID=A0A7K3M0P1_9ACTN|nr:HEAT repeat domain-containing protein [Phytoactinopolyspora mesophila]NDL56820.1 HEAT repeat domain-containing protein [Phytoactinopolyspora mesophila]